MLRAPLLLACLLLVSACSSNAPPPQDTAGEAEFEAQEYRPYVGECPRIARALGVPTLVLEIDADEVARQEALGGRVSFEAAFRGALESFINDNEHPESPNALLRGDEGISDGGARARTRAVLDQDTSYFGLVHLDPPASEEDPSYGLHRPPGQDDLQQAWVFYLVTEETYDHGHWAVVPRDGGKVFNYGFN
jgi:hypothetical protein